MAKRCNYLFKGQKSFGSLTESSLLVLASCVTPSLSWIFIFSSNYPPPVDFLPFSLPSLEFISFYFFFYFATKPLLHFGNVCYFLNLSPWIWQSNKYHCFLSNWKIHQLDPLKHHTILMLIIWEMRSKEQHLKAPHLHPHLHPHLCHHLLYQIQETKHFSQINPLILMFQGFPGLMQVTNKNKQRI